MWCTTASRRRSRSWCRQRPWTTRTRMWSTCTVFWTGIAPHVPRLHGARALGARQNVNPKPGARAGCALVPVDDLAEIVAARCREILMVRTAPLSSASARFLTDRSSCAHAERRHAAEGDRLVRGAEAPCGAKRVLLEPLTDCEVLVLGVLSLWRSSPIFFRDGVKTQAEVDGLRSACGRCLSTCRSRSRRRVCWARSRSQCSCRRRGTTPVR
jgi:hypothetical protein